jgi:tetratricopeptide (TPR) repeat protein
VWLVHKIFGRWEELEAEPEPPKDNPYLQGFWNYVHGSRLVRSGDLAGAEAALAVIERMKVHPDVQVPPIRANPGKDTLEIASLGLQGEIALARGDFDTAIDSFDRAVKLEAALGYMEPPDWAQSMRLYLGNAYLEASLPANAESVFRADLEWWPKNGWALFGLWKSLEAQGETADADEVCKRFQNAWRHADSTLTKPVF